MGGMSIQWTFHPLPTRPMIQVDLSVDGLEKDELRSLIVAETERLPPDSVVRIRIHGHVARDGMTVLRAASLRSIVPSTMNVSVVSDRYQRDTCNCPGRVPFAGPPLQS